MRRNKYTIAVLALMLILFLAISPFFTSKKSSSFPQHAVDLMKSEIASMAEKLLKEFPNDTQMTKLCVKYYQQCKSHLKVMAVLEQGLKSNPQSFDLNKKAANVAFINGQHEQAIIFGKKALAIKPNAPVVHENISESLIFTGKYQQAVDILEDKVAIFGESARSFWLLGQGYERLNQLEKAKEYYEKAIELYPDHFNANYGLGKVYLRLKQPAKAKAYIDLYRKHRAEKVDDIHRNPRRFVFNETALDFNKFSEILSKICSRGSMLFQTKSNPKKAMDIFKKGEKIFKKFISSAPNQSQAYRELAFLYLRTNRKIDQAQKLAEKALELKKTAPNYSVLAYAYYENSNRPEALSMLGHAIKLDPDNLEYRHRYKQIQKKD